MDPVLLGPDEGETLALGASRARFVAQGDDAGGRVSITDTLLEPGFPGPQPHFHREMTDMFYVLEGTLTVRLGDEEHDAGPGSFVLVPPGVVHTFANRSDAPTRMLNIQSPAGLEQYLKEVAAEGGRPDPGAHGGDRGEVRLRARRLISFHGSRYAGAGDGRESMWTPTASAMTSSSSLLTRSSGRMVRWARARTIAPSMAAMVSVASDRARAAGTARVRRASASTFSQSVKACPAMSRTVGSRSPSSVAATITQPAVKSVRRRIRVHCLRNVSIAPTGSPSARAATAPATMNSPAHRVASSASWVLPPLKW